jgi:hypothetical protein
VIQASIIDLDIDPHDETSADYVGALDALELVLDAIGRLEPRRD